jgi:FlaG/FlaF family flagellin (archaellin)
MQIRNLFAENDAVSSVVSTILMVAITIILVAVIGSFVLDIGGAVGETTPTASLSMAQTELDGTNETAVIVAHQGGDVIEMDHVTVEVNGKKAKNSTGEVVWEGSGTITAGDSKTVMEYGSSGELTTGDRIIVVWKSPGGDKSYILAQYVVT